MVLSKNLLRMSIFIAQLGGIYVFCAAAVQETYLTVPDGTRLYTAYMPSAKKSNSQPTVFFIHGYAQHCHRYKEALECFAKSGFAVVTYDARGHGRSGGKRVYMKHFDEHVDDMCFVMNHYQAKMRGPKFLVTHSLGSLVGMRTCQRYGKKNPFDAMLLVAPCFAPHKKIIPSFMGVALEALAKVAPCVPLCYSGRFDGLAHLFKINFTHDEERFEEYHKDEYVAHCILPCGYSHTQKALKEVFNDVAQITKPCYFFVAEAEEVVDNKKTMRFYEKLSPAVPKKMKIYPGMYHSLFDETCRYTLHQDLIDVMRSYCAA